MWHSSDHGQPACGVQQRAAMACAVLRSRISWIVAVAVCSIALPSSSLWAQGPLQRLGERIRARAAQQPLSPYEPLPLPAGPLEPRVQVERPPLPPVVPTPGVSPRTGATQSGAPSFSDPAMASGSANYNRARPGATRSSAPATGDTQVYQQQAVAIPTDVPPATAPAPPSRARLGATVDVPPEVSVVGQPPRRRRGAWVTEIQPQSPAAVAGLHVGDLIVAVQGRVITSVRDLIDELSRYSEGDELRIDYARDDALQAAVVTLAGPDGLARQRPSEQREPTGTAGEERSLLGGIGSIFGGLLGGQSPGSPVPATPATPEPVPQPPPPPQPPASLQPFEGSLEALPAPVPE